MSDQDKPDSRGSRGTVVMGRKTVYLLEGRWTMKGMKDLVQALQALGYEWVDARPAQDQAQDPAWNLGDAGDGRVH